MANQKQKDILSKNLIKNLERKGITQTQFAQMLDYPEMTVSNWINAKYYPRIDKIQEMADFFNINKSDLIEDKIDLSQIDGITLLNKARKIPILGTIACGEPIWAYENFDGYFVADTSIKADFIVKAKGDSMIDAGINDGDLVFLKKTPTVDNGRIGAVLIDNEATLKKVIKTDNAVILQPCNVDYQPIVLTDNEEAMILGEMVGVYQTRNK